MRRIVFALVLLALSIHPALAQAAKYNCTVVGCDMSTDPIGLSSGGVAAARCDLATCAAGSVAVCNTPVVKTNTPVSGAGATAFCLFPGQVFASGNYAVAARAIAADGTPGGYGIPFVFQSSAGAPNTPVNLHSTAPVVP